MNALPELDLTKILYGLYQRKGLIIAVFLVVFSLTAFFAISQRDVYRSSTLILITPQRIPPSYVNSTVTSSIQDRIPVITQQILSRTRLEKIINEFNLYPTTSPRGTMEDRVEKLRRRIGLDIRRSDALEVSFESESPEKAMQVANRLAALFIEENLNVREQQAMGTTTFINTEAHRLREELEQQEALVNRYKAQHQFELPDQLDANLRTLEQLRRDLQANMARLLSLQERKARLESQIVEAETMAPELARNQRLEAGGNENTPQNTPQWQPIQSRRSRLEALLSQYSERHPDVIRLKKEVQDLEGGTSVEKSQVEKIQIKRPAPVMTGPVANPVRQMLLKQTADLKAEIESLESTNEGLRRQIASYQARVDNTPLRGIELSKIARTYDITLRKYQDLLGKALESQLSENMEKGQKGEQFKIIDPANFPLKPIRPNRRFILLVGLLAGLASGFGLAFVLENLDTSFKRPEELEGCVNVPLLATIPGVITRDSVLEQRWAQALLLVTSLGIFAIGMVGIRLFGAMLF